MAVEPRYSAAQGWFKDSQFFQVHGRKPIQQNERLLCKRQFHSPPALARQRFRKERRVHRPGYKLSRRVRRDKQLFRNGAHAWRLCAGVAGDRQQRLMLLRRQACRGCRRFAECQEAPQFVAERRNGRVLRREEAGPASRF